jgi:thymidylate kinase
MPEERVENANPLHHLAGHLICLSGIDGTGKTTLAMKLKNELDSLGVTCKYIWFRNARVLSLPFLALCYLAGFAERTIINGKRVGIYHFYRNRSVARLWLWISAVDLIFVSVWKIQLPLRLGHAVIVDRYVIDALVDLMDDTGITDLNSYPYKLLLGLVNRCSIAAILTVDEEESLRRKDDSISSAYLTRRQQLYLSVARDLRIPVIDAKPSIDVVWSNFIGELFKQIAQSA